MAKKYMGCFVTVLCAIAICLGGETEIAESAQTTKKVTLGHLNAFSGGAAAYGLDGKRQAILATEEINSKGGITVNGEKYFLDLIHYDTKLRPDQAIAGFQRLVDLNNVHFIHNMGTSAGLGLLKINEAKKVLIDQTAPTATFTTSGNKLILDAVTRSNGYDPGVVKELIRRGLKKIAIIADDSNFGKGHVKEIEKWIKKLGGKLIHIEFAKTVTTTDFFPALTKIRGMKPDCLYIVAHEEPSGNIARQSREIGFKGILAFCEQMKQVGINIAGMKNVEGSVLTGSVTSLISLAPPGIPEKWIKYRERIFKRWPKHQAISAEGPYVYHWVQYTARAMEIAGTVKDVYAVRKAAEKAVEENDYLLGVKGWTKGGRAFGQAVGVLEIKNGKVVVLRLEPYSKELAEEGEK